MPLLLQLVLTKLKDTNNTNRGHKIHFSFGENDDPQLQPSSALGLSATSKDYLIISFL